MKTDDIAKLKAMAQADYKSLQEIKRPLSFDEATQTGADFDDETFDIASRVDFQRFFQPDRRTTARFSDTDRRYFWRPTSELRRRGFWAAVAVFGTICILCYFFA